MSTDLGIREVDPPPPGVPGAGDGGPRVRALSVHLQLQPRVQLLLLRHGTRLVLRHSRRRRFLLYSNQALASYFYQAIYSKDSSGGFIIIIIIREKNYKEETNFAMSTILVVLVSLSFESRYLNFRNRTISSSPSTWLEDVNGFELHKHHGQGILL